MLCDSCHHYKSYKRVRQTPSLYIDPTFWDCQLDHEFIQDDSCNDYLEKE